MTAYPQPGTEEFERAVSKLVGRLAHMPTLNEIRQSHYFELLHENGITWPPTTTEELDYCTRALDVVENYHGPWF
jgi:hypothetical protein